ncbi:uncharacterized protein [Aegilops tauschii subsp. strangulata]
MKKSAEPRRNGWTKPLEGFVKLNVDASFRALSLQGAVGVVLRDHKGGFVAASSEQLEHVADAGTAEAYALRRGLLLAQELGISKLVVESDCLEVINTMQNGGFTASGAVAIYSDCLVLVIGYTSVTFVHCPREANSVSHDPARLARPSPSLWVEEPPGFIVKGLVDDVTII